MNIAQGKYSNEYLLNKLTSSSRDVYYEYMMLDKDEYPVGKLEVTNASISFDSTAECMRTFQGQVLASDIIGLDSIDYRIVPYMCLRIGNDVVKWKLGTFLIAPSYSGENNYGTISIIGYDLGKIALDDKITSRFYVPKDALYTSYIRQLLGEDYTKIDVPIVQKLKPNAQEWEIGTSKLSIVNDLLNAINYNPIYFDEEGTARTSAFVFPQMRDVERTYMTDKKSIIVDGITKTSDAFNLPNKFVRYTESADSDYMISVYENNDMLDPYSIPRRGRTIVSMQSVVDIASQEDLDNYTQMVAVTSMQSTQKMSFSTLNMPMHGYKNCIYVVCPEYDINGRYIETSWEMQLQNGGIMTHNCEKVVSI